MKNNVEKEIENLEKQIRNLISLREEKISKSTFRILNIFKRENKTEKEIENLTSQIDRLSKKLNLLKAKTFKSTIDLRANIKNELKAYIIQKILNRPESLVIFNEINTITAEIMKEINSDGKIDNVSEIKDVIKNEMIEKLKENFEFIENKNTNTLESFKN
ncbi:hypothetical protein [Fusobacterium polymorphum]|uniref:hypothetical protein n=1 Tax=Fusobacterium nucleatum subsp. polymorphum TaxID=76857 RepID=UPI00300A151E